MNLAVEERALPPLSPITRKAGIIKLSFIQMISAGLAVACTLLALAVMQYMEAPRLDGVSLGMDQAGRLILKSSHKNQQTSTDAERVVLSVSAAGFEPVNLSSFHLLQEANFLPRSEFNRFTTEQNSVAQLLAQPVIHFQLQGGDIVSVPIRKTTLSDIPPLFWLQVVGALCAFLIGMHIHTFRPGKTSSLLALLGAAFAISVLPAAIYANRQFVLDGGTVQWLTFTSYLGTTLFAALLILLLCEYPLKLRASRSIATITIAIGIGLPLLAWLQWIDRYLALLPFFLIVCLQLIQQWRNTRSMTLERAALQWFLLSIGLSFVICIALVLLPFALEGQPTISSHASVMMIFLLMFGGFLLGILRYRLFDLDVWWFRFYYWFIGGAVIVALDLLLFYVWNVPRDMALITVVLVAGWFYFPIRQYLWKQLMPMAEPVENVLPETMQHLLRCNSEKEIMEIWIVMLKKAFLPLSIRRSHGEIEKAYVTDNGETMVVPDILPNCILHLEFGRHCCCLFTREDAKLAQSLYAIAKQLSQTALDEHFATLTERERIRKELHDGLGGKILAMMHGGDDPGQYKALARNAWNEMRSIVSNIEVEPRLLSELQADWRGDIQRIVDAIGVELQWQCMQHDENPRVTPLQSINLGRSLSEGVQNALRHGKPTRIHITLELVQGVLHLCLQDNGCGTAPETWKHNRGVSQISARMKEIGGIAEWKELSPHGIELTLQAPAGKGTA